MKNHLKILTGLVLLAAGGYTVLKTGSRLNVPVQSITALYGENVQIPDCTAFLFSKDITDSVAVTDNIDTEHVGTYTCTYSLSWHGIPLQKVDLPVTIADVDAPVIETDTGAVLFVSTGEKADLSPYRVSDNYDRPEDITLSISGDYDINTEGYYKVRITARDTSGNISEKHLILAVGEPCEKDFIPGNFDIYAYDHTGVCFEGKAEPMTDEQFDRLYFIGDSNYVNMAKYKAVDPGHVLARHAMAPGTFDLPVIYRNTQTNRSALQIISTIQPEYCIISMGLSEAGSGDPLALAEDYEKCIIRLQEACPETVFIVSSIMPVIEGKSKAAATQTQINRVNYCLMKMCERIHINMIYNAEWLTDDTGYANKDYFLRDGFHLKAGHFGIYTDCIKYTLHFQE